MIGTVAGSYKVLEKLGEGGMGTVYRAVDEMVERSVALKVLRTEIAQNAEVVERFRSEAIALARLNHPAIATLYSFFRQGDQYFMAMEFVPGETLEKQISREGAMPWQKATEILLRILEGIRHAHQMGILHRDLKPANIMITPEGQVKVTDFGIARVLNTVKLTREARVVGTLEYLAPERAMGRPADARSDLYSLGIVYYEMLTGRLPFDADTDFALMKAQIEQAPRSPREIGVALPQPIEAALMKALEKNPDDRFADAAQFAAAFRDAVRSTGMPLGPLVKPTRLAENRPPRPADKSSLQHWQALLANRQVLIAGATTLGLIVIVVAGVGLFEALSRKPAPKVTLQTQSLEPLNRPPESSNGLVPIAPPVDIPAQPAPSTPDPAPAQPSSIAPALPPPPRSPAVSRKEPARSAEANPAERILAALEETDDGAAGGAGAGTRPLHWNGIIKAVRVDRSMASPIIAQAVERRGVNFRATPDQLIELRVAGATDPLLRAIVGGYRGAAEPPPPPPPPPPAAPPDPPPPSPAPAPVSSVAPTTAPANPSLPRVHSVSSLREVRKLYVSPLGDNLDVYLREEIRKEMNGRLSIVTSAEAGDAVMHIEVQDEHGNVVGGAGRVLGLRSKHTAMVRIVEPRSKKVLWSTEAGDKQSVLGRPFGDAVKRMASRIAKRLKDDWEHQ